MFLRPQVRTLLEEDDDLEDLKEKRSIGVISLWHPNQAKRIDELLSQDDYISQRREQHDIRCGDAREFQGDEKDIILLSLVIGAGENRMRSDDKAGFNVAVSRARHSLILFHSVKVGELKDDVKDVIDVRKTLLEYCKKYWKEDDSTLKLKRGDRRTDWESTPSSRSSAWPDPAIHSFCSKVMDTLHGYIVTHVPIPQVFMLQVRSSACKKSCVFVFLGHGDHRKWKFEQEICYTLSRLGRTWKAVWLFHAIVNPRECLDEMKQFLIKWKVTPAEVTCRREGQGKRPRDEVSKIESSANFCECLCVSVCMTRRFL
jgi:hypothetical protein